jgi:alkyl sulfatase BDS1-like metallo-beta-lactamase superfamily hydrolase
MPEERILFAGGGSVGPEIPMWPNLGTVRDDRNRILEEYITTINIIIDLKPEILLPGQDEPMTDAKEIVEALLAQRDASTYVHEEIWKGLSAGKDVYQLMREIQLPGELAEAVVEADANSKQALQLQLDALKAFLVRAENTYNTFSEIAWLQSEITKVSAKL